MLVFLIFWVLGGCFLGFGAGLGLNLGFLCVAVSLSVGGGLGLLGACRLTKALNIKNYRVSRKFHV